MSDTSVYILVVVLAIVVLGAAAVLFGGGRIRRPLTPLASIALVLLISGVAFGDNRAVGYELTGAGVLVAVADIVVRRGSRGQ